MSIRFGVSPIAWINDDMPEIGGDTTLETVLEDARDIGFSGIELGGRFPRDPAALKALLGAYDLELVGGWYSANLLRRSADEEIDALQPHLQLLKAMGSSVFILAETSNAIHGDMARPLAQTRRLPDEEWPEFGRRLSTVARYIADEGLRFAYHHHLGTVVERSGDLENFLWHTCPEAGLTLDTGHAALGGIDPVQIIREAPDRIAHVHCKDVRREVFRQIIDGHGSFLKGVLEGMFTVPGDGGLDYAAVMNALVEIGYSGWVVIEAEQDPAVADPRHYARIGLATLKREAAAAGLEETA
jgi:inosose dehydratase